MTAVALWSLLGFALVAYPVTVAFFVRVFPPDTRTAGRSPAPRCTDRPASSE